MNKIFKVIWNHTTQSWVAVSELTKAHGKTKSTSTAKVATAIAAIGLSSLSGTALAAIIDAGTVGATTADNNLVIGGNSDTYEKQIQGHYNNPNDRSGNSNNTVIGIGAKVNFPNVFEGAGGKTDLLTFGKTVTIGNNATANSAETVVIGTNSNSGYTPGAVIVGYEAKGDTRLQQGKRPDGGAMVDLGFNGAGHVKYHNPYNGMSSTGPDNLTAISVDDKRIVSSVVAIGQKSEAYGGGVSIGDRARTYVKDTDGNLNTKKPGRGLGVAIGAMSLSHAGGVAIGAAVEALGINSLSFGRQAVAKGDSSVAVGSVSAAIGHNAISIGQSATSLGRRSIAIGGSDSPERYSASNRTFSEADTSIAFGAGSIIRGEDAKNSIAMGTDAFVTKAASAVAAGHNAYIDGTSNASVAIGKDSIIHEGAGSVGLGENTHVGTSNNASAIGNSAKAFSNGTIAFGHNAFAGGKATTETEQNLSELENKLTEATNTFNKNKTAKNQYARDFAAKKLAEAKKANEIIKKEKNAITTAGATEEAENSIAIGTDTKAIATNAIAMGKGAQAKGLSSISIGTENIVSGNYSGAFGDPSIVEGASSYTFGNDNVVSKNTTGAFVLGNRNRMGARPTYTGGETNDINTVKVNPTSPLNGVAALGDTTEVSRDVSGSVVIGNDNTVTSKNTFILGNSVNTFNNLTSGKGTVENSVYLGSNSTAKAGNPTTTASLKNIKDNGTDGTSTTAGDTGKVNNATVAGVNYHGFQGNTADGVVTVGSAGHERRIQNVAAGEISSTSTDAINGSQLYLTHKAIDTVSDNIPFSYTIKEGNNDVTVSYVGNNYYKDKDIENLEFNPSDNKFYNKDGTLATQPTAIQDKSKINITAYTDDTPDTINNVKGNLEPTYNRADKEEDTATKKLKDVGVADATPKQDAPSAEKIAEIYNNAATVGDVLNAGWNLRENNQDKDFVKPYDTVEFINGDTTTVNVTTTDGKISKIKVEANTTELKVSDGLASTDADGDDSTTNKGKVVIPTAEADKKKLVNAEHIANAINNSGFTLKASAVQNEGELVTGTAKADGELINPGKTVEMIAGKNMSVKHDKDGKITYATKDDVSFNSVTVPGANTPDKSAVSISREGDVGKITLNGADGATAAIKVAKGAGNINAATNTQNDRLVYTDSTGTEQPIATMNDGLSFMGNHRGTTNSHKLGSTVNIVGDRSDGLSAYTDDYSAKNNIMVDADGNNKLTVKLSKDLVNLKSVTTKDNKGNTSVMNVTGITITPLRGDGAGFSTGTGRAVSLTNAGLNNGGNFITNVEGHFPGAVVSSTSTKLRTVPIKYGKLPDDWETREFGGPMKNDAATVGDVLNAGWNLRGPATDPSKEDVDFVRPFDDVRFEHGKNTRVTVSNSRASSSSSTDEDKIKNDENVIKFDVDFPVSYTTKDGKTLVKGYDGKFYTLDQDGNMMMDKDVPVDDPENPISISLLNPTLGVREDDNRIERQTTGEPLKLSNILGNLAPTYNKGNPTIENGKVVKEDDGSITSLVEEDGVTKEIINPFNVDDPSEAITAEEIANVYNNAATVGDVLNAGWNLQGNGSAVDFVKPYDIVNFADGVGSTVVATASEDGKTSTIKVNTLTQYTDENGTPVTVIDGKGYELGAVKSINGNVYPKGTKFDDDGNPKNGEDAIDPTTENPRISLVGKDGKSTTSIVLGNVAESTKTLDGSNRGDKLEKDGPTEINAQTNPMMKAAYEGLADLKNSDQTNVMTVADAQKLGWVVSSNKTTGALTDEYADDVRNANEVRFVGTGLATVSGKTDGEVRTITVNVDAQKVAESAQAPVVYTDKDGNKLVKRGDDFYPADAVEIDGKYYPAGSVKDDTDGQIKDATKTQVVESLKPVTDIIASMNDGSNTSKDSPMNLANLKGNLAPSYNKDNPTVTDGKANATTPVTKDNVTKERVNPFDANNPMKEVTAAEIAKVYNNAATVGDVLNAGWNLQGNGKAVDFVKPYDTVNFVDGTGTTVVAEASEDGKVSTIKVNTLTQYTDENGNPLVKVGDEYYPAGSVVANDGTVYEKGTTLVDGNAPQDATPAVAVTPKQVSLVSKDNKAIVLGNVAEGTNTYSDRGSDANTPLVKVGDKYYAQDQFEADGKLTAGAQETDYNNDGKTLTSPANNVREGLANLDKSVSSNALTVADAKKLGWIISSDKKTEDLANPYADKVTNAQEVKFVGTGAATVSGKTTDDKAHIITVTVQNNLFNYEVTKLDGSEVTTVIGLDGNVYAEEDLKDATFVNGKYYKNADIQNGQPQANANPVVPAPNDETKYKTVVKAEGVKPRSVTNIAGNLAPTYNKDDIEEDVTAGAAGVAGKPTGKLGTNKATTATPSAVAPTEDQRKAMYNNAATVGDVLNAGWNLQGNGEAKDFVKPYDTVNFVNGQGTTVSVETSEDGKVSTIKVNSLTQFTDANGTPVTVIDGKGYELGAVKGKDGNIYPKDVEFDVNGTVTNGKAPLNPITDNPQISLVDTDNGSTKPTVLGNVAAGANTYGEKGSDANTPLVKVGDKYYAPDQFDKNGKLVNGAQPTEIADGLELSSPVNKARKGLADLDHSNPTNVMTIADAKNMGWVVSSDKMTGSLGEAYADKVTNAKEVKFVGTGLATVSGKTDGEVRTITVNVDAQKVAESAQAPVVYTDKDGNKLVKRGDDFYPADAVEIDGKYYPAGSVKIDGQVWTDNKKTAQATEIVAIPKTDVIASMNNGSNTSKDSPMNLANLKGNLAATYNEGNPTVGADGKADANSPITDVNKVTKQMINPFDANNPMKEVTAAEIAKVYNNAATVGDVLNAGWNLQGNSEAKDFVKPYDTVNFVNGEGTTATVITRQDGKTSDITFSINVDDKTTEITYVNAAGETIYKITGQDGTVTYNTQRDGKGKTVNIDEITGSRVSAILPTTSVGGKEVSGNINFGDSETASVTTNKAGDIVVNVNTGDIEANENDGSVAGPQVAAQKALDEANKKLAELPQGATPEEKKAAQDAVAAAQKALDDAPNKVATAKNVAEAISKSGFTLTAGGKDGSVVNPGETVDMKNTDGNIVIEKSANSNDVTYNLASNIKVDSVQFGNDGPKLQKGDDGSIKVGDKDGDAVVISNVAAGKKDTDAVNVSQLNKAIAAGKTVVKDGKNTTVEGSGTQADPYKVNVEGDLTGITSIANGGTKISLGKGDNNKPLVNVNDAKITNVADGEISPTSKDAVNGSQLYALTGGKATTTGSVEGKDEKGNDITINNVVLVDGKPLKTYDVESRKETYHSSVVEAVQRMNDQGIQFFHTNNNTRATGKIVNNDDSSASGGFSTAVGVRATAHGDYSVALGTDAQALGENTVSIGNGNIVAGKNSGAIGDPSYITDKDQKGSAVDGSYSIGNHNVINSSNTFVLGNDVNRKSEKGANGEIIRPTKDGKPVALGNTVENSVYLGNKTTATAGSKVGTKNLKVDGTAGKTTTAGDKGKVDKANVNGVIYGGFAGDKAEGVVSVGAAGTERRIQNVAAGEISATSTDAINGSQLYQVAAKVGDINNHVNKLDKRMRGIGANAAASASLPQVYIPGKSMISAAAGGYNGASAVAVGYSRASDNGKLILKLTGTANSTGQYSGGVGVGYQW